jgi:hypothetical protein
LDIVQTDGSHGNGSLCSFTACILYPSIKPIGKRCHRCPCDARNRNITGNIIHTRYDGKIGRSVAGWIGSLPMQTNGEIKRFYGAMKQHILTYPCKDTRQRIKIQFRNRKGWRRGLIARRLCGQGHTSHNQICGARCNTITRRAGGTCASDDTIDSCRTGCTRNTLMPGISRCARGTGISLWARITRADRSVCAGRSLITNATRGPGCARNDRTCVTGWSRYHRKECASGATGSLVPRVSGI